jgi:hypothetical protein
MEQPGDLNPTTGPGHVYPVNQKVAISRLMNSTYYSIRTCFIMKTITNGVVYRLVAIHDNVLADRNYLTFREAKNAFQKMFKNFAWDEDIAAEWSQFYPPDLDWIEEMLSTAENG